MRSAVTTTRSAGLQFRLLLLRFTTAVYHCDSLLRLKCVEDAFETCGIGVHHQGPGMGHGDATGCQALGLADVLRVGVGHIAPARAASLAEMHRQGPGIQERIEARGLALGYAHHHMAASMTACTGLSGFGMRLNPMQ